jgi:hypothetical protein
MEKGSLDELEVFAEGIRENLERGAEAIETEIHKK